MPAFQIWSYDNLFWFDKLPKATWIFTDLDRLGFWELELAARIYRLMATAGLRVLNDPALVCDRYLLLRKLHEHGFNRFRVWRASESREPECYPVFLRTNCAHRGTLTDLLETPEALQQAIEHTVNNGHPLANLLIVEYCAAPVREGLYAKLGAYRCGDSIVETLGTHQRHWHAKLGERGVASEEEYEAEYHRIQETPNAAALMQAFDIGNIQYGRADFTVIDGKLQVYEINTNPMITTVTSHPYARRLASDNLCQQKLVSAFKNIDSGSATGTITLRNKVLDHQRYKDRGPIQSRWIP